jgi:translation initiation factor 1
MEEQHRNRLVYSTDGGPQPARKDKDRQPPALRQTNARPGHPNDGIVRVARDRKGRGGKTVTLVTGLPGDETALRTLAQTLKRACGSGGTVKDGVIEIQGDHRERLAAELRTIGYPVKIAGG